MVNTTILSVNTIFHFLAEWIQCRAYDQYFSSSNSTGVCCYWLNELNFFFYRYSYSIPKLQILRLDDICTVVYHYIFHNLKDFFRRVIPPNCQRILPFFLISTKSSRGMWPISRGCSFRNGIIITSNCLELLVWSALALYISFGLFILGTVRYHQIMHMSCFSNLKNLRISVYLQL